MKIFEIYIPFKNNLATLRPVLNKKNYFIWDDWDIIDNSILDFIPTHYNIVGRQNCLEDLSLNFNGISLKEIKIEQNPKEKKVKNKESLKWLPNNYPKLLKLEVTKKVPLNSKSTVLYDEDGYIEEIEGIEEVRGNEIIKLREQGKGLFINKEDVKNVSFFSPINTSYSLCTEHVKEYIEEKKYTNICFLEVGNII